MIQIDMPMPDNCDECRFNTEYGFCKAMPDNFCGNTDDKKRPEWCPMKEQQPKTARWEKRTGMMPPEYHGHYWCSNCDWHGKYNEREKDYKFCPACGAKMENPTST
jgi:hypothetical protein